MDEVLGGGKMSIYMLGIEEGELIRTDEEGKKETMVKGSGGNEWEEWAEQNFGQERMNQAEEDLSACLDRIKQREATPILK